MKNIINESYKSLICESDGWNEIVKDSLDDIIIELEGFIYEVKNCVKGAYTGVKTHEDLANYIRELADRLNDAANEIEDLPEDKDDEEYDEESIDESIDNVEKTKTDTDNTVSLPDDDKNVICGDNQKPVDEKTYIVMVGDEYVSSPTNKLTKNPNFAGVFSIDSAEHIKNMYVRGMRPIKIIPTDELFTDGYFDEDKANIYFKYNQVYESIQRKKKQKNVI